MRRASDMTCADRSHAPAEIQRIPSGRRGLSLLLVGIVLLVAVPPASARDLIVNGGLTAGTNDQPNAWKPDLWSPSKGTAFEWKKGEGTPGILVVRNLRPNDSRWVQDVAVEPNRWYRLSGFIRAVGVSEEGVGANLALMRGFDHSEALKGDTEWTPVGLWFKTKGERSVKVACRLGGFGQISAGEAWCTGIRLEQQAGPPLNANYVYGPIEESTAPVGFPTALGLFLLLLYGIGHHGRVGTHAPRGERMLFAGILLVVLAAKIAAAPHFQYKVDVGTYSAWAMRLATEGPARFYAPNYFADYPPGYMYVLWGVGLLAKTLGIPSGSDGFIILLKLPALLTDAAVSWLLYARLRGTEKKLAWSAALAFTLNPALLFNSAVWGQTDSVLALLVLLAVLAQGERRFELSWIFAALAVLTKPQALLLVPLLLFWPRGWWKSGRPLSCLLAVLAVVFTIADPFRGDRPWMWLVDLYFGTTGYYAETSVNAMNLAALLFGMRHNDAEITLGISANNWGLGIGLLIGLGFFVAYLLRRDRLLYINLFASATLVSFLCLTRMHERYLYPFFVFGALVGVTGSVGVLYWSLSALFLANELIVYLHQQTATAGPDWLWRTVAALNTACMFAWLGVTWQMARGRLTAPGLTALEQDDAAWLRSLSMDGPTSPINAPSTTTEKKEGILSLAWIRAELVFLLGLTAVAFGLRTYAIDQPIDLVFDEVYFVEQARNYLNGVDFLDPHPPFAKLMIGLGIGTVGDTPFGWRIMNAIVGTVLVVLMYILARELFQRRVAAAMAALFVTIDGLCIVDSRIAVIDIHYVTWAVAAYILTIRLIRRKLYQDVPRLLLIGLVLGISVGSKLYIPFFSFLLVLGALTVTGRNEALRRQESVVRFLLKPVLIVGWFAFGIYVLTYTPHYLWGWWHSPIDLVNYILVEVPNYQSAVADAAHPYSSKWYTWPLLLRPVWYFWKDPGPAPGMVVGIWGSGNPAVWWAAVPALLFASWHAVRERRMALGFVAAGWLLHLAPWVGIGRTLFLYHYLPSLLFAFLALAWLLDRLWNGEGSKVERGLAGSALLASLFPVVTATTGTLGTIVFLALLVTYYLLVNLGRVDPIRLGRVTVGVYCVAILAISWYFLPIWLGIPVTKQAWQARMWISGSGIMNWI
ncbi:MAG: phospholipid carrier-dependent glycosyltransferase [Candidatus Binatia bacterium]|nr:phospholipid carrier-dependent glycosyltransferase [Candidatus Binatia bacterium]